jgi:hypothetical protein
MKKDNFKFKWNMEFTHTYTSSEKIKSEYDKIFNAAKNKITEFEKEKNIETIVFFNHDSNELSLYGCDPDNYETKMECHHFLDYLNDFLKESFQYPQIT